MISLKMQQLMNFLLENDGIQFKDQKIYKSKRQFKLNMFLLMQCGLVKRNSFKYSLAWRGRTLIELLNKIGID